MGIAADRISGDTVRSTNENSSRTDDEVWVAPVEVDNRFVSIDDQWEQARLVDTEYQQMVEAVKSGSRVFPSSLGVRVSINECSVDEKDQLLFRGRRWVPNSEPLRVRLIQEMHDSHMTGHPGREGTAALMIRQFFWPCMLQDVRRFVRNCDICNRNKAWRERRYGFLKPLPVPNRVWSDLSIDFITDLPQSKGCSNIMVITDRLSKGVIFEACADITVETLVFKFLRLVYRNHGLPKAIVSDRGTQFTSVLWKRLCQQLGVTRRLSTAYHPETDGSTERMNQTLEAYLRAYVNYNQDDWADLLYNAELAVNNRDATSTGVSPFFLTHGYHVEPLDIEELTNDARRTSPIAQADQIVRQLKEAREYAEVSIVSAQQDQEASTNAHRHQAPTYKVGDKVWLDLANIRTTRKSKKLDWKHAKFTVTDVVSSHSYRLDTPPGVHNVFHTKLLRPAATDPFKSQITDDAQPEEIEIDGNQEWEVEEIREKRIKRRGRGQRAELLVKWAGYARPTWEPYDALQDTIALDVFEDRQRREEGVV